jgi:hypothetical protein
MTLSREQFRPELDRFKEKIRIVSGAAFETFHEGLPAEWESYKPPLRARALEIMGAAEWRDDRVGSGDILRSVIAAVEIREPRPGVRNNLVRWENRFGHANRSHHKLLDAIDEPGAQAHLERMFFDLYRGQVDDSEAFEQLRSLVGNRYDLLSYFFFLRDSERYMPLAPRSFDQAFERLGIDLVTARKCSWDNYVLYNEALSDVQTALRTFAGITDARLIDAHSFCWMLVNVSEEDAAGHAAQLRSKPASARDPGRTFNARETSVLEMARSVERTVKSSSGPPSERTPKLKELRMSRLSLENLIKKLLDRQEDKCALTGISVQFQGEQEDDLLLPSLDRIDSDGHYEEGNLQVVCRFINFWKGDEEDEKFRRLLSLVRGDDN